MGKKNYEVYSAEFKMSTINQYQQSGMTIKAFAESVGVKPPTFYSWLRKIWKANINSSSNKLIDITSLVKNDNIPIEKTSRSNTNHLSIKGVELDVDDNTLLKIVRELRSW